MNTKRPEIVSHLTVLIALLASPVSHADLSSSPYATASTALYHLDNNLTDSSAGPGADGTARTTTSFSGNNGPFNQALNVSATQGFTATTGLTPNSGASMAGTIDFNLKLDPGYSASTLWRCGSADWGGDNQIARLDLNADGSLTATMYNPAGSFDTLTTLPGVVSTGVWQNIALVWNRSILGGGSYWLIKINDVQVAGQGGMLSYTAADATFWDFGTTASNFRFAGPDGDGGSAFNGTGLIDEVRVSFGAVETTFSQIPPLFAIPYTTASTALYHLDGDLTASIGNSGTDRDATSFSGNNGPFNQALNASATQGFTATTGLTALTGASRAGTIDFNLKLDPGYSASTLWLYNSADFGGNTQIARLDLNANGSLTANMYDGNSWQSITSAAGVVSTGVWQNIALVWNGTIADNGSYWSLRINDAQVAGQGGLAAFGNTGTTASNFRFAGPGEDGGSAFNGTGLIDEVRVSFGTLETAFTKVPDVTNSAYQDWLVGYGLPTSTPKGDDSDNDGVLNLAEFALNGNPTNGSSNGAGQTQTVDANGDSLRDLTLTVQVRAGASFAADGNDLIANIDGVAYRVEGSIDLSAWESAVAEVTPHLGTGSAGTGYEFKTFRLLSANGLTGKGFLRVVVSE